MHVGALVLNKVLPDYLLDPGAANFARRCVNETAELCAVVEEILGETSGLERVLAEIGTVSRTIRSSPSERLNNAPNSPGFLPRLPLSRSSQKISATLQDCLESPRSYGTNGGLAAVSWCSASSRCSELFFDRHLCARCSKRDPIDAGGLFGGRR